MTLCLVNIATTTVMNPMMLGFAQGRQNQTHNQTTNNNNAPLISILANNLANRLNKSAAILQITSNLPEIKNHTYASFLKQSLHGIAANVDIQKRKVAQAILSADKDFGVIFFLMPNGLVYMEEPYSRQLNLTTNNLGFRDFYKGVVSTHMPYLGNVVISASSGRPQTNIAVPVYSENNNNSNRQSLLGIWAGGLNLAVFNKSLQSLNLTNNEHIVFVDHYGQKIADSDKNQALNSNQSFANFQSFKNAVAGEAGSIAEVINGTKVLVSYHPVNAIQTKWAILDILRL
ncbi:MAG TPA: cache domain-containing protein [Bacillus sp. (in: firmicutes)]|nr:cache domain-containing protein [Bacillus sp. (in: firmicutes)]